MFMLFSVSNKFRTYKFTLKDQLVIIYSGLRGASNFSLAFLLPATLFPRKKMFITSTIVVIYFTVFIQGVTIRPLVKYLDVKKTNKKESINEEIHMRLMDHLTAGVQDICGHWSHYQLRDKFKKFDNKFLKKVLVRNHEPKSSIYSLYKKLEIKQVIEMVENRTISQGVTPTTSKSPSLRNRKKKIQRLSPEEVESIQDMLAHNLYQVRQRTLSYNRYNLATEASEEQAKEILIRNQCSLRRSMRKGNSLPWGGQAASKSLQYLSLPFAHNQLTRSEARNDHQTGDSSSDSESVFIRLNSKPQSRLYQGKRQQQELLPMKQLYSRVRPAGFVAPNRTNERDKRARIQKPWILSKPPLNAVHETKIQELESEDEFSQEPLTSVSSIKWTSETRGENHFYGPPKHFPHRK